MTVVDYLLIDYSPTLLLWWTSWAPLSCNGFHGNDRAGVRVQFRLFHWRWGNVTRWPLPGSLASCRGRRSSVAIQPVFVQTDMKREKVVQSETWLNSSSCRRLLDVWWLTFCSSWCSAPSAFEKQQSGSNGGSHSWLFSLSLLDAALWNQRRHKDLTFTKLSVFLWHFIYDGTSREETL